MTSQNEPREQGELDRSAADIIDAFRLTIRLLNALAPVADQVRALQETLLDLQSSALGSITPGVGQLPPGPSDRPEPAEHLPSTEQHHEPPEPMRRAPGQPESQVPAPEAFAPSSGGARPQSSFPAPGINRQQEMTARPQAAERREEEPPAMRPGASGAATRTIAGEARPAETAPLHQNPATGAAVAAAPREQASTDEGPRAEGTAGEIEARGETLGRPVYATPATENGSANASAATTVAEAPTEEPSAPAPTTSPAAASQPATPSAESGAQSPSQPAAARRTVSVTVSRNEGPLDLVRVHGALESVPGVTGLALTSYTRGRAGILLETDRPPTELDLGDALGSVFLEGVNGGWEGDNEYVAVIGEPEEAS